MAPNFIRTARDSKSGGWGGNEWQLGVRRSSEPRARPLTQSDLRLARGPSSAASEARPETPMETGEPKCDRQPEPPPAPRSHGGPYASWEMPAGPSRFGFGFVTGRYAPTPPPPAGGHSAPGAAASRTLLTQHLLQTAREPAFP